MSQEEYKEIINKYKEENKELIESGKCKKVFLECLPRKGKLIDWKNSVGYKVYFIYENISGEIEIVNHKEDCHLDVLYNNRISDIKTSVFTRCGLGRVLGLTTKEFRIEIGETFKNAKRDITIIDRYYKQKININGKIISYKYYKYKCNKCGNEDCMKEYDILNNYGCNRCGKSIKKVDETNCLATTHPHLMKYLANKEDGYKYRYGSHKKILCKCPNCGYEKEMTIKDICEYGFSCNRCGDNTSFPEKIMTSLLKYIKIDFIPQYSRKNNKWCDKYRYDFYFEYNNDKFIIETHGEQHYKEKFKFAGGRSLHEEKQNDLNKYNLAIQNGIKPENYIVIDCRYSNIDFIKENILKSRLNDIFDLRNVDWEALNQLSQKSIVKEICDYWKLHNNINNENLTTKNMCDIFKISRTKVTSSLKKGNIFNWCYYNEKEEWNKTSFKKGTGSGDINKKPIQIYKDGKLLNTFCSIKEMTMYYLNNYNIKLNNISATIKGRQKTCKGFTFKYITKEEYNNYISGLNK